MKPSSREALSAYYREAGSWATDRVSALQGSRRIAWIVASLALAVAVIEAIALIVMLPLKTVVPYTLMVDRTTGYVQALKPLDANQVTPDQALIQSMLVQYVIAREGFDIATLQNQYRRVGLWSADQARRDYLALMEPTNPANPLVRNPRTLIQEVRVKSVSPLSPQSAMVRFDTADRYNGGSPDSVRSWVAIIEYRFSGAPMSTEDRYINPLGFQVTSYRRDPEALPTASSRAEAMTPYDAEPLP